MSKPQDIHLISDPSELEAINGSPNPGTLAKKITRIEQHARRFIETSPFAILCTYSADGCDASPRGDPAGFAVCLDETTLLIPERPGNRIADSLRNLLANPDMALLFMIPGMDETLRVNGRGYVTDHAPYLERLAHKGKSPKLAIVLDVTELYFHCPKAFIRSDLWGDTYRIEREQFPTLGRMLLEQISGAPPEAALLTQVDENLVRDTEENLY